MKTNKYSSWLHSPDIPPSLPCASPKLTRQNSQEAFVYEHRRNTKPLEISSIHEGLGLNIMLTPSLFKQMFQASPLEEKRGISFISLQVSLASSTHSLTLSWAAQCLHRWFIKRKNLEDQGSGEVHSYS